MKLIVERIETVNIITEAAENGKKNYFIEGIFMQAGIRNRNGRVYPLHVLEREVGRYIKEAIAKDRAVGELGHPDGPGINLDRISHKILSLKQDGNNFIGRAKILNTPHGIIVKNLLDEGISFGVSSRGMGSLKQIQMDTTEVQEDFYLATAADIVADPSAPEAFVNGIMEGKEWVLCDGQILEQTVADIKKRIQKTPAKRLKETAIEEFEKFMKSLK